MMTTSLQEYHRNYINICEMKENKVISTYYKYKGSHSTYVFFVNDNTNLYVETQFGSVIIPYADIREYAKLYVYYIISLQLTPIQSNIYYDDRGHKGVYKEIRNWYILTNICWKSQYMSFGDYCYFKECPTVVNINNLTPNDKIFSYITNFNNIEQNPYIICNWLINYEIYKISSILYDNELTINKANQVKNKLEIITKHFNINDDIKIKILYQYYQLYII